MSRAGAGLAEGWEEEGGGGADEVEGGASCGDDLGDVPADPGEEALGVFVLEVVLDRPGLLEEAVQVPGRVAIAVGLGGIVSGSGDFDEANAQVGPATATRSTWFREDGKRGIYMSIARNLHNISHRQSGSPQRADIPSMIPPRHRSQDGF